MEHCVEMKVIQGEGTSVDSHAIHNTRHDETNFINIQIPSSKQFESLWKSRLKTHVFWVIYFQF